MVYTKQARCALALQRHQQSKCGKRNEETRVVLLSKQTPISGRFVADSSCMLNFAWAGLGRVRIDTGFGLLVSLGC